MNDDVRPTRQAKAAPATSAETTPNPELETPYQPPETKPTTSKAVPTTKKPLKLLAAPKHVHWWLKSLGKKQRIAVVVAAVLLLGGAVFASTHVLRKKPVDTTPSIVLPEEVPPEPTTVASRMTGLQIEPVLNELPTTGVMIENSPDARPQSGLAEADLVYEAIAEGGITRFLALYQESSPENIGPVRSARPYYLDFLGPYDAALAHAGGSAEALADIRAFKVKDLDHGANGGAFSRVSSRFAPHNLYTSRERLLEVQDQRGYTSSEYTGLARKEEETPAKTPNASLVDFTISSSLYNTQFAYDAESNSYKRSMAGRPHADADSGDQITPKVVIGVVMAHRYKGIYSVYDAAGSNVAYIFQDGIVIKGTWEKDSRTDQFVFKKKSGEEIKLNPGRTWITVVASEDRIKVTP